MNLYSPRYVYPALLLIGVAGAILIVAPASDDSKISRPLTAAALIAATAAMYGRPSLSHVRESIDVRFGRMTPAVLASGAKVIAGDYWTVWPSVFHANLERYRRTRRTGIYGLTYRSSATDALWAGAPAILIAAAPADSAGGRFAARINLTLIPVEQRPTINVFLARPAPNDRGHSP